MAVPSWRFQAGGLLGSTTETHFRYFCGSLDCAKVEDAPGHFLFGIRTGVRRRFLGNGCSATDCAKGEEETAAAVRELGRFPEVNSVWSSTKAAGRAVVNMDVRCAVRFPLSFPVSVESDAGALYAHTENISASGVLLTSETQFQPRERIRFSMRLPSAQTGITREIMVHCQGRVIRCYEGKTGFHTAVTIDEYRFGQ